MMEVVSVNGIEVRLVPQYYNESLDEKSFCGGSGPSSKWIYRDDLIKLLHSFGYKDISIDFDTPDHANGPSFAFYAQR